MKSSLFDHGWRCSLALVFVGLICAAGVAQERPASNEGEMLLPRELELFPVPKPVPAPARAARFRLFGMQPGFLSSPVGLDQDDDPPPESTAASLLGRDSDPADNWIQVSLGTHNPFFDLRRRGDPGGVGFYKLDSQFQLFDTGRAGCNVGFQAVTPAGEASDGLTDGPTFVSPSLAMYYALDDGTSLHGFVAKHVRANSSWDNTLKQSIHYGVAVQRPVGEVTESGEGLYFFMQALGRYRYNSDTNPGGPAIWELLPGLHWRFSDSVWMSGGYVVPLRNHIDSGLWQITCSWQF